MLECHGVSFKFHFCSSYPILELALEGKGLCLEENLKKKKKKVLLCQQNNFQTVLTIIFLMSFEVLYHQISLTLGTSETLKREGGNYV